MTLRLDTSRADNAERYGGWRMRAHQDRPLVAIAADGEGAGASEGLLPEAPAPEHAILKHARAC